MAKSTGDRHWHLAVPVLIGAVALAAMPIFMSRVAWAAFACLSIAAFGIWAGHGPLMSWPAILLSGTNAASGERLGPEPSKCSVKHMARLHGSRKAFTRELLCCEPGASRHSHAASSLLNAVQDLL